MGCGALLLVCRFCNIAPLLHAFFCLDLDDWKLFCRSMTVYCLHTAFFPSISLLDLKLLLLLRSLRLQMRSRRTCLQRGKQSESKYRMGFQSMTGIYFRVTAKNQTCWALALRWVLTGFQLLKPKVPTSCRSVVLEHRFSRQPFRAHVYAFKPWKSTPSGVVQPWGIPDTFNIFQQLVPLPKYCTSNYTDICELDAGESIVCVCIYILYIYIYIFIYYNRYLNMIYDNIYIY